MNREFQSLEFNSLACTSMNVTSLKEEEWDYFTSIIGSIYTHNIIEHTTFIYFGRRYLVINREHLRLKVHFLPSKSSGLSREDCFHDAWKFNSLMKFLQINNVVFYDG